MVPNLVLKYMIKGDDQVHVRGAVRIKVDGSGALIFYAADNGNPEAVSLNSLRELSILPISLLTGPSSALA